MDRFDEFAPVALERLGLRLTPGDLEMLSAVASVLDPVMGALDDTDLATFPLEVDGDPGRPPRSAAVPDGES
jgi:hypothetical protein